MDTDKKEKKINKESKKEPSQGKDKFSPSGETFKPIMIWVLAFIVVFSLYFMSKKSEQVDKFNYSQFIQLVEEGQIAEVIIYDESVKIKGFFYEQDDQGRKIKKKFVTQRPKNDVKLYEILRKHDVKLDVSEANNLFTHFIISFVPTLLIVLLLWFLISRHIRGIGKGTMSFGKSRAKVWNKQDSNITFKDVAGIDEAKEEVEEIIDFLKNPDKFVKLGGRIPKGVLLMGPPGTGKTLLAKAIAGEADVPFFNISGSDFVEMFVGVGASRVRDLFEQGNKNAPSIIFIDEIDAVGRHRGAGIGGGHDEREQTLNAILVEMDGFTTDKGVIIIAATNRPDVLDPALLRPGRFDRQIVINLPDIDQREKILRVHARNVKMSDKVDLRTTARGTVYFSGADLANLINEAALLAARRNKTHVEMDDMEEARDKVLWGRERKSMNFDEEDKKVIAYHEAGHTIISEKLEHSEPVHKVSIIPRGHALGMTMQLPRKDQFITKKAKLLSEVMVLYGGRIAEEVIFKEISTGSSNDIKRASKIVRKMVTQWGMSDVLGPITYGEREEHIFLGKEISRQIDYSEETAVRIDEEVKKLAGDCYARAKNIMIENEEHLHKLADYLLKREVLTGEEVRAIMEGKELPPLPPKEKPSEEKKNEEESAEKDKQEPKDESNVDESSSKGKA